MSRSLRFVAGMTLAGSGCSNALAPNPSNTVLTLGAHAIAADTIGHQFPDTIVVRLRAGEDAVTGAVVRLTGGRRIYDRPGSRAPFMEIRLVPVPPADTSFQLDVVTTTDEHGEVRFTTQAGLFVGQDYVLVSAPLLEHADSLSFEIKPGRVSRAEVSPADTAVLVGTTYPLRVAAFDRDDNPLDVTTTVTSDSTEIATGGAGAVTARAIGRATLRVDAGGMSLPAAVSVVPNGIIAAAFGTRILATRTDGSSVGWDPIELPLEAEGLSWRPTGDLLAFDMGGAIHLADSTGRFARMFQRQQPFVDGEAWVAFLPNASAVLLNSGAKIWRIVLPTGATDQLPSPASAVDLRASTSPDGTRAAFSRDGIVSIINLQTKAVTSLQVFGTGVRWSPDGGWIAYGDGSRLWVVHPDGSGAQSLAQPGVAYAAELDWSPDSKWIVVTTNAALALVDPATRTTLPLPSTLGGRYPAWRPIP